MASNGVIHLTDFAYIKDKAIKADIPPEKTNLSADELELKKEAQQIADAEADAFESFLSATQEDLNQLAIKNIQLNQDIDKEGLISATMNQAEVLAIVGSEVQKDLASRQLAIAARVKLMEADALLKRFRAEHDLMHREAKDAISSKRLITPILLITLFEVVMYTNFYRNDHGLLGGFFTALTLAVVSLAIYFGLGYGFRYHNLIKPPHQRIAGWFALPAFIAFIIWANATLACYRLFYQLFVDNPLGNSNPLKDAFLAALDLIFFRRLPFGDIDSFIMFFLGIVFGTLAFVHGYTIKDAYPGYQEKDEKKKQYQTDYEREASQFMPDKIISQLAHRLDDIIRQSNNLHRIITIKEELINKQETYQKKAIKTNGQLGTAITYFREHHLAVRANGMSAPVYFNHTPPTVNFTPISIDPLLQKIDSIAAKNQLLDTRINQTVTPTLKMINIHKPQIATEAKREFIRQVDKAAQEHIHPIT